MKKLIIALFAMTLTVVVNAASVTWSITNIKGPASTTAAAGWLVQVFDSSVSYDYNKAKSGNITAKFTSETTSTSSNAIYVNKKESDVASANEKVKIYAVIYDAASIDGANNYIVSDILEKTVPSSGADIVMAFGSMTGTTTANKFLNSSWQSVPEPTSGLLLLLGVAGLALKRKCA